MKCVTSLFTFLFLTAAALCQDYSWDAAVMDGSRTKAVKEGSLKVRKSSSAFKVARIVENARPRMQRVKEVIGFSEKAMYSAYPESALSNWTVDVIMEKVGSLAGRKIDIGFANFGGIRVDMPEGDIILDDILSMFPFKNNVVYLEHKGSTIRKIIEEMAATRFQVLGGLKVVVEDGKVTTLNVGEKPLDDDAVYTVATNSFLLKGGDNLFLERDALSVVVYPWLVDAVVIEHIRKATAEGRAIKYDKDGRVVIKD